MIPKTLLLSTMALSGVCYAGLLCSTSSTNGFIPWIKENFEKIKPLLDESLITTAEIDEENDEAIYVAGSLVLKPREDSSPLEITPIQVRVLPKKEERTQHVISTKPTIPPTNTKNQPTKPKKIPKPRPNTLISRSPKLMLKRPANGPKPSKRLRFRGRIV